MRAPGTLEGRIALWSGLLFLTLYAAAACLVLAIDTRNHRSQVEVMMYSASEALASYYASTHRLDFPELKALEAHPVPVWVRIIKSGEVLAETPGTPRLPGLSWTSSSMGHIQLTTNADGDRMAVLAHDVWNEPGTVVEAVASHAELEHRRREILFAFLLSGLVLLPLSAFGGRLVAARSLQPLGQLVGSVRGLHSESLEQRLEAPGAVEEIAELTEEFNRLLERLEASVAAMRRFTADASHELRTPISILRTGFEVALRKERSGAEYRELIQESLTEIQRIQRIVETLLTLARTEGEKRLVPSEALDFSRVVAGAIESMRPMAAERRLLLEERLAPGVMVRGDADLLRLLVVNLLDNALKLTPEGLRVRVAVEVDGPWARLEVEDEGPGVQERDRPYVFDRFFRAQSGRNTSSSAGGLGLSLVRWVAESHGGHARLLDSRGAGARFEVALPLLTA